MKTVVADYRYRVLCMRIVPVSGSSVYLTDHVHDLVIGGHTYLSTSGYQFTGYSSTSDMSPSSIDIEGIAAAAGISITDVASGLFDGARCYCFATTWLTPVEDEEEVVSGLFGKTSVMDDRYQISGVSLVDTLNQTVGKSYGAQCPKVFLSQTYGGCMVPAVPNTVTGTLTTVVSASVFGDSGRSEPSDTFGAGSIRFTTGLNAGLKALEIKTYASGSISTHAPFPYLPVVGDAYVMTRGCRKRSSDCKARWDGTSTFNNIANFGGFEFIPTGSTYAHVGGT